jgi:hypothetical protein
MRRLREVGPASPDLGVGERSRFHDEPGTKSIEARTLLILDLEKLDEVGHLAGGGDHLQVAGCVNKHQPGVVDGEHLGAALHQEVEHLRLLW